MDAVFADPSAAKILMDVKIPRFKQTPAVQRPSSRETGLWSDILTSQEMRICSSVAVFISRFRKRLRASRLLPKPSPSQICFSACYRSSLTLSSLSNPDLFQTNVFHIHPSSICILSLTFCMVCKKTVQFSCTPTVFF